MHGTPALCSRALPALIPPSQAARLRQPPAPSQQEGPCSCETCHKMPFGLMPLPSAVRHELTHPPAPNALCPKSTKAATGLSPLLARLRPHDHLPQPQKGDGTNKNELLSVPVTKSKTNAPADAPSAPCPQVPKCPHTTGQPGQTGQRGGSAADAQM